MNRRIRDFFIGSTAIVGLGGLALTLFLFGEFRGSKTYPLRLDLDNASGLTKSSLVTLNGVRIGEIRTVEPARDPREGAVVGLAIIEGIRVPRDLEVSIDRSFVGDSSLSLRPRSLLKDGPLTDADFLKPGDAVRAKAGSFMDQIGSVLDSRLGSLMGAADDFRTLSGTWTRVGERAEALMTPRPSADVDAGRREPNLATAIARIDRAAAAVQAWLGDEEMRGDAKRAVARASDVFDKAAEAVDTFNATAKTINDRVNTVGDNVETATREVVALSNQAGEAINELRGVLSQINQGEGTVGQLVKNPDLYNALTDAARRLEKALTEAQLIIEKYRKEGIPIRF